MPRRREKTRVLGPYPFRDKFRIIICDEGGQKTSKLYASEAEAASVKAAIEDELKAQTDRTIEEAIEAYEVFLRESKQNKPQSCSATAWRLRRFFADTDLALNALTPKLALECYEKLVTLPSERTKKPLSADSHRNFLAEAKTFLGWCVRDRRWLKENPLAEVQGRGRRRHGKPQLRIDEARQLRTVCHEQAAAGNDGAVAVLIAMLMGLRASEIVSRTVRDLDDGGRILWIDDTEHGFSPKTEAGRRPVTVWEEIRPYLLERTKNKLPGALLFPSDTGGSHWRDWVREQALRLCKLAGVPAVSAHSLRGFAATLGLLSGVPLSQVAASLGHESASTTLQSYAAPGTATALNQRQALAVLGPAKLPEQA